MIKRLFVVAVLGFVVILISVVSKTAEIKPPLSTPELIASGKQIYAQQCAACHGLEGRGDGEAAYLLYPKPRDFVAAKYRLVSTWDRVPTDQDLFDTISRGMPGSAIQTKCVDFILPLDEIPPALVTLVMKGETT